MDSISADFDRECVADAARGFAEKIVVSLGDISEAARDFSELSNPSVIKGICMDKIATWKLAASEYADFAEQIKVSQIMAGLTNQLFSVAIDSDVDIHPQKVLFRIYGSTVGDLYDSDFELTVFKILSNNNAAPQLFGTFEGGRIEQFLDGPPLLFRHMTNPSIVTAIANILAKFHRLHLSVPEMAQWSKDKPSIWSNIDRWSRKALKLAQIAEKELRNELTPPSTAASTPAKSPSNVSITSTEELFTSKAFLMSLAERKSTLDNLRETDLYRMLEETSKIRDICLADFDPEHPLLQISFCHNDVQENNILCTGTRLRLIDFEYSSFNYPAFDIANFLCEMTMDYCVDEPPHFTHELSPSKFPSEDLIKLFGSVYMSAVTGDCYLPADPRLDEFVKIIHRFILASHLQWGFWSIVRAPQAATSSDFDFILYAKSRFDAYKLWKKYIGL